MKEKVKWSIEELGYKGIEIAHRDGDNWIVPFAQIEAMHEKTLYFICLEFNKDDYTQGIRIGLYELNIHNGFHFDKSYRPFLKRLIKRELGKYSKALISVIWYLENWDREVCKDYKEIRGHNPKWEIYY